ncbi:hypothetical protein D9M72_138770 [compost metagenome]
MSVNTRATPTPRKASAPLWPFASGLYPNTVAPAATPAVAPVTVSSTMAQRRGSTPSASAAARYTSGQGLLRGISWPLKTRPPKQSAMPTLASCSSTLRRSAPEATAIRPSSAWCKARTASGAPGISNRSRSSASLRRWRNWANHSWPSVAPVRASISGSSSLTAFPVKMRMVSSCAMSQPISLSICVSTRLVMGSESTRTPSQSNSTASKGKSVIAASRGNP